MIIRFLRRACVALCGAALLFPVADALAQHTEPMVPRALALALLGFPWNAGDSSDLLVGAPSPTLVDVPVLPRGARYLGALVTPEFQITVITGGPSADSLLGAIRSSLERSGWRPNTVWRGGGGFQAAPSARPAQLCKGKNAVTLAISQRSGEAPAVLAITGAMVGPSCGERPDSPAFAEEERMPAPLLTNPPGTRTDYPRCNQRFASSSGSGGGTPVTSPLTPRQLLDAYARQLDSLGWHRVPAEGAGAVVSGLWQRTDSSKAVARLRIAVEASDSLADCRTLRMDIERRFRP